MPQYGSLITNNCILKPHEQKTINFLLSKGLDIELLPTSSVPGTHTADVKIDGVIREIKAPKGDGAYTMQQNLRRGKRQSNKISVDLYRCKRHEKKAIAEILKEYSLSKRITEVWIITKSRELLEYKKD